jgi:hypothetical protein
MSVESVIEKTVALIGNDKVVEGMDGFNLQNNVVSAVISDVVYENIVPLDLKMKFVSPIHRVLLKGLVTAAALYANDYVFNKGNGSYIAYLKKAAIAEASIYGYHTYLKDKIMK